MEKSILLERRSRILWILIAVIFSSNGVIYLTSKELQIHQMILGVLMLLVGVFYAVYSFLGFSVNSKYAAKAKISDQFIELKTSFWKSLIKLNWQDVNSILLGNYKVEFKLANGTKSITYNTSAKRSKLLKQLLRESAEQRKIQVIES